MVFWGRGWIDICGRSLAVRSHAMVLHMHGTAQGPTQNHGLLSCHRDASRDPRLVSSIFFSSLKHRNDPVGKSARAVDGRRLSIQLSNLSLSITKAR